MTIWRSEIVILFNGYGSNKTSLPSTGTYFSGLTEDRQQKFLTHPVPLKYSMSMQRDPSIVTPILPTIKYCGADETFTKHLQCRLQSLDDTETSTPEQQKADDKTNNNELYYEYENSPEEETITEEVEEPPFINGCETFCNTLVIDKPCTLEVPEEDKSEIEIEEEIQIPRIRRCSSLKSGKTPPSTPGEKKIVRFADVLGLDLADVRTYLDEIPKVPTSAFEDLSLIIPVMIKQQKFNLVPLFQQPGGETDFLDRVRARQCCLENACVQDEMSIGGTVRVRNIDFSKSVHIRYTLDGWITYSDLQATYVPNSCDGFSDKFSFVLYCHTLDVGQRLEFAVRYSTSGMQFWDNNGGVNYCFQCLPAVDNTACIPLVAAPAGEQWADTQFY